MRILVVEDDGIISDIVMQLLVKDGYEVDVTSTGEEGISLAQKFSYDAMVLDIMLPKIDGFEVLKSLRSQGIKTPVLFLTSRSSVEDTVKGLDLGADDFLPKPFWHEELLERIGAIIRRTQRGIRSSKQLEDQENN